MARLSPPMVERARETIALYPHPRSALIPLLHLAQEQDGWVTPEAMEHIGELLELTPAEVLGTASNEAFDHLVDELAAGRLADEIPPHGTLCRTRRSVGLVAGAPEGVVEPVQEHTPVEEQH